MTTKSRPDVSRSPQAMDMRPRQYREPGIDARIQTIEWGPNNWRYEAACRSMGNDRFFPIGITGEAVEQIEDARAVCRNCGVQEQCLEFALATNQQFGIWGAKSEEERRPLRRAWLSTRRRTLCQPLDAN
jgi:WhiB family transcriptional regulator, redox-sensing transcriptional regulator